jgi:small-conductance mechanosensitive channel
MNLLEDTSLAGLLQSPWVMGPAVFILWMFFFYILKWAIVRALHRASARRRGGWEDVFISAMSTPLLIAVAAGGLVVFGRILPLTREGDRAFDVMFTAALALSLVLFADRLCLRVLERLSETTPILQGARGLIQGLVRSVITVLGLLIFLDGIGISITPLLASLGIGSLAVALALKDTLANLFSGIQMIVDKPIEPGHFVRLEGGQEGIVSRVGWRSTWIRTTGNSVVVVPNSRLAESVITNHALPDPETEVPVELGVHHDSDLDHVERVTMEVAREAMGSMAGGLSLSEPVVRFHGFAESGITLRVLLRTADYEAGAPLRHDFIKRIHRRYREEGIVMPYPTRTLDLPPDGPERSRPRLATGFDDEPTSDLDSD